MKKFLPIILLFSLVTLTSSQTKVREGEQTMGALPTAQGGAPTGGTTNQILSKNSAANYDYSWVNGVVSPVTVPNGGTGLTTLTIHDLYVGNGTSSPNAVATGNAGQVLISNGASADPTFQDPIVSGPDAIGVTPTRNPVQVGALFQTTPTTLTNNQVGSLQLDSSQNLLVKLNVNPTVTANAGTNLNTSALALDTSVNGLLLGQASTTSGQKGPLLQGAVTTSAPSYTTAQTDPLSLDTSGNLRVTLTGTNTISGTVTANQGSPPWSVSQSGNWTTRVVGNAGGIFDAAGQNVASPANEVLTAGQFNTSPTTITSGNVSPLQLDSSANLLVNVKTGTITANQGGTWNVALSTGSNTVGKVDILGNAGAIMDFAGQNAAQPANSLLVAGEFNTSPTTITSGNASPLQLDSSGNLLVNVKVGGGGGGSTNITQWGSNNVVTGGTNGSVGVGGLAATNAAIVGNPVLIAGSDYGGTPKAQDWKVDSSGNGQVAVTNTPTVTANAGTNLNTSALALDTSVNGLLLSQASTTSGQKGPLLQGAVTTSAPSYTTAQTDPLSLTTAGALRVDGSAVTQPVSGTVTANAGTGTFNIQANASTNVAQFGGTNVVTGTGASGAGIPRVTVSNDSSLAANQSVNTNQIGGSAISTAATGVQKVGVVGNAAATLDGTVAAGAAPTNGLAILEQYKATQPAPTDTQTLIPQVDQAGNTRISYGAATTTLSVWNSGTSLNTTQNIFTNYGGLQATILLQQSAGTFTAGAITFEVSYDGTNWVAINSSAVLDPTDPALATIAVPYTLVTSTNKAFSIQNLGWVGLRIKLSTAITGTGTVTPVYTLMPEGPGRPVTLSGGGVGNNINIQKVGGQSAATATTGTLKVGIVGNTGSALDGTNAGVVDTNVKNIAGSAISAAATGIQKVGISGFAAAQLDQQTGAFSSTGSGLEIVVQHTRSPTQTDSTQTMNLLQGDIPGNLKTMPGMGLNGVLSVWNSSTTVNSTQAMFGYGLANADMIAPPQTEVALVQSSGTFTAGAITFEVIYSDNGTWVAIPANAVIDPTSTTGAQIPLPYTLVTNNTKQFLIINSGWFGLRIKLSTAITGTGTLTIGTIHLPVADYVHVDHDYVAGGAVSTSATGVQKVGVVGSAAATLDAPVGAGTAPTNGVAVLGQSNTTAPAPTNGQTLAVQLSPNGNVVEQPYRRSQIVTKATTITSASATTILAAQGAGIFADLTSCDITVTPVASSNTIFTVTISDGTNSYIYDMDNLNTDIHGVVHLTWNPPLVATTANTAWTQTNSSATPTTHTTVVAVKQSANF